MSLIKIGPREFHADEVTYPPGNERDREPESYFAEESWISSHFLFDYLTDSLVEPFISRPKFSFGRVDELEEIHENLPNEDFTEDALSNKVWGFSPEGFEGNILDIVFSDSFQNLRGKAQHGPISHFAGRFSVSRFEHSIDALMVLRYLGATSNVDFDPALQIYTVAHDLGHGAGSHWAESVLGSDYELHEERIRNILEAEGLLEDIHEEYGNVFEREYNLMDASKPDLSIDRLSYLLKDVMRWKGSESFIPYDFTENLPAEKPLEDSFAWKDIGRILEATEIHEENDERELVITKPEIGKYLAEIYMDLESMVYFNPGYDAFNRGFADAARIALNNGTVDEAQILAYPDREAINLISEDDEARDHLDKVFEKFIYEEGLEVAEEKPDLSSEIRRQIIDPKIREHKDQSLDEMARASNYSEELREEMERHLSQDGEIAGFDVIGWDYPKVRGCGIGDYSEVLIPSIDRMRPGRHYNEDYWMEKKEDYKERGMNKLWVG